VDQPGHHGHHQQHDRAQGVQLDRPGDLEGAGIDPGEQLGDPGLAVDRHLLEHHDREERRNAEQGAGHHLGAAVADRTAEQAGDDGADQRQNDDGGFQHIRLSPSSG
jgi:hypothetical protein